jgi:hypothetical protein
MTTILHEIDLFEKEGEAAYAANDDFGPVPEGLTRYYRITEGGGAVFLGTLLEYENTFGGVQGKEDVLFAWVFNDSCKITVIDSDTKDFLADGFFGD